MYRQSITLRVFQAQIQCTCVKKKKKKHRVDGMYLLITPAKPF